MNLNVKERLMLIGILPQEGSLSEMVDVYDLAKQLKLSDQEKELIAYKDTRSYATWKDELDPNKDIQISSDQNKIVLDCIEKLDKQGKIGIELVPIILKFKNGSV